MVCKSFSLNTSLTSDWEPHNYYSKKKATVCTYCKKFFLLRQLRECRYGHITLLPTRELDTGKQKNCKSTPTHLSMPVFWHKAALRVWTEREGLGLWWVQKYNFLAYWGTHEFKYRNPTKGRQPSNNHQQAPCEVALGFACRTNAQIWNQVRCSTRPKYPAWTWKDPQQVRGLDLIRWHWGRLYWYRCFNYRGIGFQFAAASSFRQYKWSKIQ